MISVRSPLVQTIAFYVSQTRHKNVTNIISLFVTLPAVSMLSVFSTLENLSSIFKKLLLRMYVVDFVEICNVCARKVIIKAVKRIINSDKMCHSYSDLNFGITSFGT